MKGTLIRRAVVVSLLLAVLVVPRVSAQAAREFLSGTGVDTIARTRPTPDAACSTPSTRLRRGPKW